jgi:hypothetical protein
VDPLAKPPNPVDPLDAPTDDRTCSDVPSALAAVLAAVAALADEHKLVRLQLAELATEVKRLAAAQQQQQQQQQAAAAALATAAATAPPTTGGGDDGGGGDGGSQAPRGSATSSDDGSRANVDRTAAARALKPLGPPTVRRVASLDRPAQGMRAPSPQRRASPKSVL